MLAERSYSPDMVEDVRSTDLDGEIQEYAVFWFENTESLDPLCQQRLKRYREPMPEQRIVTNQVFVLGLDELYRQAMKRHESAELLQCAEKVASVLSIVPVNVPIEGYYTESPALTRYFQLVRELQAVPRERESELFGVKCFQRLKQVTQSPILGTPGNQTSLLPASRDALFFAMEQTFPDWSITKLTAETFRVAVDSGDYSLVAIAALSKDPVVLTACRESTILYAEIMLGCFSSRTARPEYIWQVDSLIEQRAKKFIDTFNQLFNDSLPEPSSKNVEEYFAAYRKRELDQELVGRCARLGCDDSSEPIRHYHWAIKRGTDHQLMVEEFWDTDLWTTQRYSEKLRAE